MIAVSGEIDIATVEELRPVVERAIESGAIELWLDLSDVAFMDSSGLKLLLDARTAVRLGSRRLSVAFAIYPDRATAHAAG